MAIIELDSYVLKAKYRGCMIGGLLGDCLGEPFIVFEDNILPSQSTLSKFLSDVLNEEYYTKTLPHTDDTRMTLCIASSIAEEGHFDLKDIAKRFVDEYYRQPHRAYGAHVTYVFHSLRKSNFKDIFHPAKLQFNGSGSYGNGGAVRVAPLALFGNKRGEEYVMNIAKKCALITHAHPNGYNGAILQCLAVNAALELDPSKELDPVLFIDTLLEQMENIENEPLHFVSRTTSFYRCLLDAFLFFPVKIFHLFVDLFKKDTKPYCESLQKMKQIFLENKDPSPLEIAQSLGNGSDVSALKAVPPAIYSFLRGTKPFKGFLENQNPFVRTVFFAISLGGDTDTIGSMAGSIAGAYYGEYKIPDVFRKSCEGADEIALLADKLFDATYKEEYSL